MTEAVHSLQARGEPITVRAVADELGIDRSGASRLVRCATEAGYLTLGAVRTDRRQRPVTVTADGDAVLHRAHDWQETVFARLTRAGVTSSGAASTRR